MKSHPLGSDLWTCWGMMVATKQQKVGYYISIYIYVDMAETHSAQLFFFQQLVASPSFGP